MTNEHATINWTADLSLPFTNASFELAGAGMDNATAEAWAEAAAREGRISALMDAGEIRELAEIFA